MIKCYIPIDCCLHCIYVQIYSSSTQTPKDPKPENLCTDLEILVDIGVAESRERITILEKFRHARVNYALDGFDGN